LVRPEDVSLLEIAETMGYQDSGNPSTGKTTAAEMMLQEVWEEMSRASREVLSSVRLSDLAERFHRGEASMFYI
jgi:DNA-binding IscR family transcriptional regulator